jgi:hypothetical protein
VLSLGISVTAKHYPILNIYSMHIQVAYGKAWSWKTRSRKETGLCVQNKDTIFKFNSEHKQEGQRHLLK